LSIRALTEGDYGRGVTDEPNPSSLLARDSQSANAVGWRTVE
jgi:hypothetical protein